MAPTSDATPKMLPYYTHWQIALACLLGSPVTASWLVAATYRGAGDKRKAMFSLMWGVAATVALVAIIPRMPKDIPRSVIAVLVALAVSQLARHSLKPVIEDRISNGAQEGSWWMVVGITLVGMIIAPAVTFGIVYGFVLIKGGH